MYVEKGKLGACLLKLGLTLEMTQFIVKYTVDHNSGYEDENILIAKDTCINGYYVQLM